MSCDENKRIKATWCHYIKKNSLCGHKKVLFINRTVRISKLNMSNSPNLFSWKLVHILNLSEYQTILLGIQLMFIDSLCIWITNKEQSVWCSDQMKMVFDKMVPICLDFRSHSKSGPFANQPLFIICNLDKSGFKIPTVSGISVKIML